MNKKMILLILLIISGLSYSEDTLINLISEKVVNSNKEEDELNNFFNAIKYSNNTLALSYINGSSRKYSTVYSEDAYAPGFENAITKSEIKPIDINKKNSKGESAVILAIEYGNNVILKQLLEKGVDLNVKHPVLGRYPIHTAAYFQNKEAVEMLVSIDKDFVNIRNENDGWMPLEDAVLKSNVEIVKFLIENGADPRLRDYSGSRAIDLAVNYGKGEIVKLLRDKIIELRKNKGTE